MDLGTIDLKLKSTKWHSERPVIVILSGAGLSAESGIATYRTAEGGWVRSNALDAEVAKEHPEALIAHTNDRLKQWKDARPNAAHRAIADFALKYRDEATVVHITQNIDSLSEMAGDVSVFHLHGSLYRARCSQCGLVMPLLGNYSMQSVCPKCNASAGAIRPDIVLFGEIPMGLDWIMWLLKRTDVFIAVGTSCIVYPAADFVSRAARNGCRDRILINKEPPPVGYRAGSRDPGDMTQRGIGDFNRFYRGKATELLPRVLAVVGRAIEERRCPTGVTPAGS